MPLLLLKAKKVFGQTAIPKGRYEVAITFSNKYKRMLPLLMNVPCYEGVRIHSGNRAEDTEGCILVGRDGGADFIGQSRKEFAELYPKIEEACKVGKVFITVQ